MTNIPKLKTEVPGKDSRITRSNIGEECKLGAFWPLEVLDAENLNYSALYPDFLEQAQLLLLLVIRG